MRTITRYVEASVIVAGTIDEVRAFTDHELMREWLADVQREADEGGHRADVYVLWHDHPPDQRRCGCVQDPFPYQTFKAQ